MLKYVLFAIMIAIMLLFLITRNGDKEERFSQSTCACVFDIDNTITCGHEQARNAINECKKNGCKLALNTARIGPYYNDVKFENIGLEKEDIIDDVYHGIDHNNINKATYGHEQLFSKIAEEKVKHLYTIQRKYNIINPKRIILFDDMIENVTKAKNKGFSAIHANGTICGLNQHVVSEIKDALKG
jgi:hypothetical protein